MNAWTSSPPSLDTLSSESSPSSSAFLVGWHIASGLPRRLWDVYVAYLWYYQPNSWIGRLASAFRILAVMLVLPVALLTLLDVTSYVIARTLGVVDDVKASTIDGDADTSTTGTIDGRNTAVTVPVHARVPTTSTDPSSSLSSSLAHDVGAPVRTSEGLAPEESVEHQTDRRGCVSETPVGKPMTTIGVHAHAHAPGQIQIESQIRGEKEMQTRMRSADQDASDASPRAYHFAGEVDLRLAGEGIFSPVVSMPPSPLTPRMPLHTFVESDDGEMGQVIGEGTALRRRVQNAREDESGST